MLTRFHRFQTWLTLLAAAIWLFALDITAIVTIYTGEYRVGWAFAAAILHASNLLRGQHHVGQAHELPRDVGRRRAHRRLSPTHRTLIVGQRCRNCICKPLVFVVHWLECRFWGCA